MAQSRFATRQLSAEEFVESCGALIFDRPVSRGGKVCLVNLIRRDEWLLAKGRRNVGESRSDAALREAYEETGYSCRLLPVTMATRACDPAGPPNAPDQACIVGDISEPFMCTIRDLPLGKGTKIIYWFIAVLDDSLDATQQGPGEADFKAEFFEWSEAVQKLYFETDRQVLRRAIHIMESSTFEAGATSQ